MSDIMIARSSAIVAVDGVAHRIRRGRTTAHADAAIVHARPEVWQPFVIDFPAEPMNVVVPGPSPKAVRAWAKGQGIEVPARGKLPEDVIAQYQAAHE